MITKFKLFESKNTSKPKVGDYAWCVLGPIYKIDNVLITEEHRDFFKTNFGKIIEIELEADNPYHVVYDNLPDELKKIKELWFDEYEIIYFSKNKVEVEAKIEEFKLKMEIGKYNI